MASGNGTTFAKLFGTGGTAPPATAPGASPSTPSTSGSSGAFPQQMTATQLLLSLGISSTDAALYLDTSGNLNARGTTLVQYLESPQASRQLVQAQLSNAGLLPAADATGDVNNTTTAAFTKALGEASSNNQSLNAYLATIGAGTVQNGQLSPSTGAIQQQISGNLSAAQKLADSSSVVTADETNSTTLAAAINNAFNQALGYAPSQDQINAFVSAIHQQDVATAEAGIDPVTGLPTPGSNKALAEAEIKRATSQESALNKLGPDGVDAFLQAYQQAVTGTHVPGAGSTVGPQTGLQTSAPPAIQPPQVPNAPYPQPQTGTGTNRIVGYTEIPGYTSPSGDAQTLPTGPTRVGITAAAQAMIDQQSGQPVPASLTKALPVAHLPRDWAQVYAPSATTPLHGGVYALSPVEWKQAIDDYQNGKYKGKYPTAGSAPLIVQQAAVREFSENLFTRYGNWPDVAIALAGGTPGKGDNAPVLEGAKLTVNNFAKQVAARVNQQLEAIQNEVNQQPTITVKTSAPDYNAEASQAAKEADPIGYDAANFASVGDVMSQMIFGSPKMFDQTTADTFTGPVAGPSPAPGEAAAAQAAAAATPPGQAA